jgi:glutaredoxin
MVARSRTHSSDMFSKALAQLLAWIGRRPRRLCDLQVILYTRQGCHLCEPALQQLRKAQQRYAFGLSIVDVDSQSELQKQYGDVVPVVTVNGQLRFRGAVNEVLLARLLRSEAQRLLR